ncbi:chemotaxis protein methyltransferase CheR [Prosthecobacter debontii]|uniref:Chemotaxis protein methyltransferase CheR n=1 Tax=Prosthecobacter debontii TaxID=48467 RepID=A0A1T4WWU1_9BACT|nr:protein-glutamate O-methyltransferase CheR [Prosthecobacter debontii]SKA81709.1 chemotaxis protein methyltransferase CheR [Prosthecobacter debontii]
MIIAAPKSQEWLSDPQFLPLKDWIIQRTGLSYYSSRETEFAAALERVFGQGKSRPSAGVLLSRIQSNASDLDALVEELTIGETFFFRHLEMFQALQSAVFPDILQRKAASKTLRIWSAGCSIGAEPYSIAILLREMLGMQFKDWSIQILGTDINRRFLRVAQAGAYDPWALRGMPPQILHHCFTQEGNKWRLTDRCRSGVTFRSHNLASDPFPNSPEGLAAFDLIICRNVMIYFDQAFIQKLAHQFHDSLSPGGWLAVGHAEPHTNTFRMFRTVNTKGAILYQRPTGGSEILESISTPAYPPPRTAWAPLPVTLPALEVASDRFSTPESPSPFLSESFLPKPDAAAESPPQSYPLEAAMQLADRGALLEALQACDTFLLNEPLSAAGHCCHGMILYQLSEWVAAERSIRRSLYLKRDLALAHYYLGLVQERQGHNAKKHYQNALDLLLDAQADDLVPLGQGLTVREFRSLLAMPETLAEAR